MDWGQGFRRSPGRLIYNDSAIYAISQPATDVLLLVWMAGIPCTSFPGSDSSGGREDCSGPARFVGFCSEKSRSDSALLDESGPEALLRSPLWRLGVAGTVSLFRAASIAAAFLAAASALIARSATTGCRPPPVRHFGDFGDATFFGVGGSEFPRRTLSNSLDFFAFTRGSWSEASDGGEGSDVLACSGGGANSTCGCIGCAGSMGPGGGER
jgi:hypothetical protein